MNALPAAWLPATLATLAGLAALAAWPGLARAQTVPALYSVTVAVADRLAEERAIAKRTGFARLLKRLSGRDGLLEREDISAAFESIDQFVTSYHYQTRPATEDDAERPELVVEFQPDAVANLLKRTRLPIWSSNRPVILLWLALRDGGESRFVGGAAAGPVPMSLAHHLRRLGLPFDYPLFDLADQGVLPLEQALRNEAPPLYLFERYRADSLLSGHVTRLDSGSWRCQMTYQIGSVQDRYAIDGAHADDCIGRVIDQVATKLFRMYTVREDEDVFKTRIDIEDVLSFADYVEMVEYLGQLSPVQQMQVLRVAAGVLTVEMQIHGSQGHRQLRALLANDNRMVVLSPSRSDATLRGRYRWLGAGR